MIMLTLFSADPCASINCNYGTCHEGQCICSEGYTGTYCDSLSIMENVYCGRFYFSVFEIVPTLPPAPPPTVPPKIETPPIVEDLYEETTTPIRTRRIRTTEPPTPATTTYTVLQPQMIQYVTPPAAMIIDHSAKKFDWHSLLGWLLALLIALLLIPLCIVFAIREFTRRRPTDNPNVAYVQVQSPPPGIPININLLTI